MMDILRNIEIERNFIDLAMNIYTSPTANIILNGEKLEAFSLQSGKRQGCPLAPLLLNRAKSSQQCNRAI